MALLDVVDARIGDGLESLLCAHHSRRLRKLGWGSVFAGEDGWWSPRSPVRDGNRVDVLVDGHELLPAVAEAISSARESVHLAGWCMSPDFRLTREPGAPTLRELLAATAERVPVRVLLWAGPPVPMFEPTRKRVRAAREEFMRDSAVSCVIDARERTMHCHHEKIVVVDGSVAFVGGMDLTAVEGDRHDTPEHPPRHPLGWHDIGTRLRGPVVADVAEHFRARWQEIAGEELPPAPVPGPAGTSSAQLVRTIPERTYDFVPRGEFSLLDSYLRALRSATRLVYLENQFLWSPEVTEILIEKLRNPPDPRFRVVLVLPRKPSNGADTTRGQLGRMIDADDGGRRLIAATLSSHDGQTSSSVYVHAKLAIVDDRWLSVGSANLNEHSLFNDTEVNVVTDDADLARRTRLRLWSEHLRRPVEELDRAPEDVVDGLWRDLVESEGDHRVTSLPGVSRRAGRLQGPLRGLLVDG